MGLNVIRQLNDIELVSKTKALVSEDRLTQEILEYLAEIERRRLFALRGYASLFMFCTQELGYSASSAQRRIASMRLIRQVPEAKEKLISGKVNLCTLSQLYSFIKGEEKMRGLKMPQESKLELLAAIESKSQRECEREFIKRAPLSIRLKESKRMVTEELTEIKFLASNELNSKLETLKNLFSHRNKTGTTAELIEILADVALRKTVGTEADRDIDVVSKSTSAAKVEKVLGSREFSKAEARRQVWARDQRRCQYVDPLSGRKCLSPFRVQIDHIRPKALGGNDNVENLRVLCATHNQLCAIQTFSKKHISRFVPDLE